MLGTTTFPHGISYYQPNVQMASLDHALWFHRPFRADEWLLYSIDSPTAPARRGMARGLVFHRDGRLVASSAQEGLIRVVDALPASARAAT
jgi:acyl-CoA thioesterase-2